MASCIIYHCVVFIFKISDPRIAVQLWRAVCTSASEQYNSLFICIDIHLSTAIGLTPGGRAHLHINNTQNITINNKTTRITNKKHK
jgi:hypothetical protein